MVHSWRDFLGRKVLLCLTVSVILTVSFGAAVLITLIRGTPSDAQALIREMWTPLCTALVALFTAATAGNVMEHRERTKQGSGTGQDGPAK